MPAKDGPSSDVIESSAGTDGASDGEEAGCFGDGNVPNAGAAWPNLAGPADEKAPKPPDGALDPKAGEAEVWPNGEVEAA